jgi:hypothetical protein
MDLLRQQKMKCSYKKPLQDIYISLVALITIPRCRRRLTSLPTSPGQSVLGSLFLHISGLIQPLREYIDRLR